MLVVLVSTRLSQKKPHALLAGDRPFVRTAGNRATDGVPATRRNRHKNAAAGCSRSARSEFAL
jgi:hypothetical protein